jgi:transcriptional regulator with XRE-family HTH domain
MDATFAERLLAARTLRKLTQTELAAKVDLPPSQVAHYEAGSRKPSYDNLRAFCVALRVNSDYLLGITQTPFDALRGGAFVVDPIYQLSQKLSAANHETAEDFLKMLLKKQKAA